MGIPAPKIPLLFKKFSQLDNSTTRLYGGSGLGLVIVHELARLMKGDAWCESDFGKGSVFHFSFEAGIVAGPITPQRKPLSANSFRGKVVAIIGLGAETRKTVVENLLWLGFDVLQGEAGSNFNALLESKIEALDLVVLSTEEASRSTEAMADAVVAIHPRVRVVFVSKQRQTAAQIEIAAESKHPVEFLSRPLKVGNLAAVLRRLFPPVTPPVYTRKLSARKAPEKIPRLSEASLFI